MNEDMQEEKKESTSEIKRDEAVKSPKIEKRGVGILWGAIIVIAVLGGGYYLNMKGHIPNIPGTEGSLEKIEAVDVESKEQWSYAIGSTLGMQLGGIITQAQEGGEIDRAVLLQAIYDVVMESEDMPMTQEQIDEVLNARGAAQQEKAQARAQDNLVAGSAFVEEYEAKEGVQKSEGGTLYTILEQGSGPSVGTGTAMVQYRGKLIDGTEFDSSFMKGDDPVAFTSGQVIPGLGEVLEMMKVGDKWEIVIPSELAYGEQGIPGVIDPNSTLVFEIAVKEIQ